MDFIFKQELTSNEYHVEEYCKQRNWQIGSVLTKYFAKLTPPELIHSIMDLHKLGVYQEERLIIQLELMRRGE